MLNEIAPEKANRTLCSARIPPLPSPSQTTCQFRVTTCSTSAVASLGWTGWTASYQLSEARTNVASFAAIEQPAFLLRCDQFWQRATRSSQKVAISQCPHRKCLERSEEHTSELQSLMRISYAVLCLKKKNNN